MKWQWWTLFWLVVALVAGIGGAMLKARRELRTWDHEEDWP